MTGHQNYNVVMLVEDSSVESFNIKVAHNNISLKKPKSFGFIQSDILNTEPNYPTVPTALVTSVYVTR